MGGGATNQKVTFRVGGVAKTTFLETQKMRKWAYCVRGVAKKDVYNTHKDAKVRWVCWAVLCYAMLGYAMLCYAMLCYANILAFRLTKTQFAVHARGPAFGGPYVIYI